MLNEHFSMFCNRRIRLLKQCVLFKRILNFWPWQYNKQTITILFSKSCRAVNAAQCTERVPTSYKIQHWFRIVLLQLIKDLWCSLCNTDTILLKFYCLPFPSCFPSSPYPFSCELLLPAPSLLLQSLITAVIRRQFSIFLNSVIRLGPLAISLICEGFFETK